MSIAAISMRFARPRRLQSLGSTGWTGLAIVLTYLAVALTGPFWAPFASDQILAGDPLQPPSSHHLLGTDNLGRDVFSRVVLGSAAVIAMTFSATGLAVLAGTVLGLLTGYVRGWFDEIMMRLVDILISIPPIIFALLLIGAVVNHPVFVVLAVAFLFAPRVARVVRAATLAVVTQDYIAQARTRGESTLAICFREILPNVAGTVLVEFAIRSGFAVIFIGALGFLGFGAPPPTPEWGLMINEGRSYLAESLWPVLSPAFAISGLVIGTNLLADGLARSVGRSSAPRRPV